MGQQISHDPPVGAMMRWWQMGVREKIDRLRGTAAMVDAPMEGLDIKDLLIQVVEAGGSDLHVTVGTPPWIRVKGELLALSAPSVNPEASRAMVRAILSPDQMERLEEAGEIDLAYSLTGISRFRVNVFKQRGSLSLAVRVIPSKIPRLSELGLPMTLEDWTQQDRGLVLVTGPTGCGKSTTLAAMIGVINQRERKRVITLEDPIEYLHRHERSIIDQREVGMDTLSFSAGLRAALRQDPDVLMVGEMRDVETIRTAVTAAETGHLVFATLHTVDAAQTVHRIVDVFGDTAQTQIRTQLAGVLVGVLSQRLIPAKTPSGRAAVTEVLVNTSAVSNVIRGGNLHQLPSIMQTGRQVGMQTLSSSLQRLAQEGKISADEQSQWNLRWGLSRTNASL